MKEEPRTWHYGVIARYWAQFNLSGPEIDYFRACIGRFGEPALDMACGTGRLLIPYLQAGLDVDGCDISADMIELCRERAAQEGLSANLYVQAIHELSLPRMYKTIIFCGGFGLGGYRSHDIQGLKAMYQHLEPGGALVMDEEVPYANPRWWPYWLREERTKLPEKWREGDPAVAPDGFAYRLSSRIVEVDPLEQRVVMEMRAQQFRGDELIADEHHEIRMMFYFKEEITTMLHDAGFSSVEILGDHNDKPPTPEDDFLVFVARK